MKTWADVRAKREAALANYDYPATMSVEGHRLKEVGSFLALHKYYDVDRRFEEKTFSTRHNLHPSVGTPWSWLIYLH